MSNCIIILKTVKVRPGLPKNICKISSGKIFKLKASCADRSGRGGAVSGLTDNLAAKQSPAVSCGDQRAVHFTPPCNCQAHIPPTYVCVYRRHSPTWSPLSPPQFQINIALLHCKSQWNLECQYLSSSLSSQLSFSLLSAHLRLIFL